MVSNTENMEQDGNGSQLFEPYMELGRIVDSNAFLLKPPTQDDAVHSIIVSIGKAYRIYNTEHIKVTFTSRQLPSRVRSLAYVDGWVFAASGFNIYGTKQGYEPITFQGHTAKVESILGFGKYLISVSRDNTINFWSTEPPELYHSIKDLHNFDISVLMHPDTYVNKILVASKTGAMKLLNIMSQKIIYSFKGFGSPILCVEQSPAIDVVGIGCQNGNIYIHNLKFDQTVVAFNQVTAVTSLSFRSDSHPMLVTGGADGTLTVWNLEKKKLSMVLKGAHGYGGGAVTPYSAVTGLKFLAGEPLLISTGADNSIKTWVFDKDNTEPHLLRFKSGHYRTITSMKFYPTLDQQRYTIVTASQDRDLRIFAASAANHNLLFSQGERLYKQSKQNEVSLEVLKRNVITDFDFNNLYEKDWDNIITCHEGENTAQTWRYLKNKIGAHKFISTDPDFRAPPIKAVCVSSCGNFGLLGNVHGYIDRYNMQSGLHRGTYIDDTIGRAHTGSIQGLVTDALNRTLISAGLDGYLKFWDFASQKVQHSVNIGSAITKILLYKENSLLAVVSDDLVIRVYDVTTQTMVRKFTGHTNQITDIVFNHDGRWLISASSDTTVRTWDMVAGRLIDWFRVSEPVIALAFHPQGKFLVTSHAGECCLFLWVNRAFYGRPLLRTLSSEAPLQSLPTSSGADEDQLSKMLEIPETREFVPLDASLLTLSDQPRQKFEIVTNIDVIKERNKPEKAPEKPASAPFFLPTLPGLVPQFAPSDTKGESFFTSDFGGSSSKKAKGENGESMDAEPAPKLAAEGSKIMSLDTMDFKSEFERKLKRGNANKDYSEAFAFLKKLSPSGIDFEIQGLSLQNDYEELKWFMEMLTTRLQAHDDYDMCQALMSVFLKHHSQVLMENSVLLPWLTELREHQHLSWLRVQREFHSSLCLIKYFSGIQM